jgi:autophagy-related protein 2
VPADILTSGIVIEISGVEVHVRVEPQNKQAHGFARPEQNKAPAKGTKSNRPRIATPSVHDPGGQPKARYGPAEDPFFYPDLAVHQLAESFLQTESQEDRLELQAAIVSQSRYGRDSLSFSTTSEEEFGIGAAESYSLPSFIASYLVGIADRLQLRVVGIVVHAEFVHSYEGSNHHLTEVARSTRFLIKLSELFIEGVTLFREDDCSDAAKRKVTLDQFSIFILGDPANDASDQGSSEAVSPVLKHSQTSLSPTAACRAAPSLRASSRQSELFEPHLMTRSWHQQETDQSTDLGKAGFSKKPPKSTAVRLTADVHSSMEASAISAVTSRDFDLSGSPRQSPPLVGFSSTVSEDNDFQEPFNRDEDGEALCCHGGISKRRAQSSGDVDNQEHAEAIAKSGQLVTDKDDIQGGKPVEDLTESKIFTHDEAESIYMSAMSSSKGSTGTAKQMPGAWDWSAEQPSAYDGPDLLDLTQSSIDVVSKARLASSVGSMTRSISRSPNIYPDTLGKDGPVGSLDSLAQMPQNAKLLLLIDRASAWLPAAHTTDVPTTPKPEQPVNMTTNFDGGATKSRPTDDGGGLYDFSIDPRDLRRSVAETHSPNNPSSHVLSSDSHGLVEVEISNVHFQVDMQQGKTLIAVLNSTSNGSEGAAKKTSGSRPSAPMPRVSVKVSNVEIAFLEQVPELSISAAATKQSCRDESLLLSISLAGLAYRTSFINGGVQQQLEITRISFSHSRGTLLSFSHESEMKTSLKDTAALQENDIEMSFASNGGTSKVEIHSKPIRLTLELGQVDDILSRSGGLSSLLELGNSIVSSSSVRTSQRISNDRRVEPRGVRFEGLSATESRSHDDLTYGLGKVNVRMGGISLDIVGSECTLKASTSAIKIVHRTEGMGMQIDRVSLHGPFLLGNNETPALSVCFQSIRMEYLPIPNDKDLSRLLAILTPSKDKYDADDDIMLDTLLRQRRKGGVLRLTISSLTAFLQGMSHLAHLKKIGSELARLSTVAKYLPEDDRPGILSLGLVKSLELDVDAGDQMGRVKLRAQELEGSHVNVPSLLAAQIGNVWISRNEVETMLGQAVTYPNTNSLPPMVMCRFVADEMDPTVKLKLFNVCVDYHVSLITAVLEMVDTLGVERSQDGSDNSSQSFARTSSPSSSEGAAGFVRRTNISMAIRDSALALNPRDVCGRALFILTDAVFSSPLDDGKDIKISAEIKKASVMVIDKVNVDTSSFNPDSLSPGLQNETQARTLSKLGYVPVGYISSARCTINISQLADGDYKSLDLEFGNALLILESCADSTQTLISILNGLAPPAPPVKLSPYRTEIVPLEDLLASFSGDAFITEPGPDAGLRAEGAAEPDMLLPEQQDIEYVSDSYQIDIDDEDDISESGIRSEMLDSQIAESMVSVSVAPVSIKQSVGQASHDEGMSNSLLDFRDDHFGERSTVRGKGHRWDSTRNTYGLDSGRNVKKSPLKIRIRDVHVIWNLFDGYDWQSTRDIISEAVRDIESRAAARRPRSSSRLSTSAEDEEESVIGDFLFNSIYIGIAANRDPRELANDISRDIDDLASETGSYATSTTITTSPGKHQSMRPRQKKMKLRRSKQHKMTFELKGLSADIVVLPSGSGEVQSSIDVRLKDLEIFDHLPTSTWKKFATYMHDAGERQAGTSMIHLEILNVKPVPDLAASEMILKVTVLPLRLHIDQDALDFMSRFFEFKNESAPPQPNSSTPPFLQRVEVNPVKIKLDFKPKRVDYGGLRSGRTTEFMNFFVLDQADMVLRRVILYGVSGFDRLGIMLNNIWMPDVKRNQLPGILAGLAPIRSLVNVGSGVKDLVVVPMREYKKDGRIVRSIQKGALAFAKTTSKELIGLGAKLALGTQTVLQNAETMLAPTSPGEQNPHTWEDLEADDESRKQISLYADQPIGVIQGLRGAYASLERDLLLAKDAIIAVPGEAMASGSASGAAKAILKQTPTVILRPAIGASKAVGQTLLGAGNTLDRENWRRAEEVCYLTPPFFLMPFSVLLVRSKLFVLANFFEQKYKRH